MKLGIISDTHGHLPNAQAAVRMLESLEVDEILHCGDIGSAEVANLFAAWPLHFVLGNCDSDAVDLRRGLISPQHQCHGRFADLTLGGKRIALLHSDDAKLFHKVIQSETYDLVCYGHSHIAEQHLVGKTLVLNPGALFRAARYTIAQYDCDTSEAVIVPV